MVGPDLPRADSIRVTLVIGNLGPGGAERNLVRLAGALATDGYAVTLLTLNRAQPDFYDVPDNVTRIDASPLASCSPRWHDWLGQVRKRRAVRAVLLETLPDVVISFIDTCNVTVLGALWPHSVPVIVSERIDWRAHSLNWRWHLLRRLLYPTAKRVVCLAREPARDAANYWPPWRAVHIANPVPALDDVSATRPAWFGQHNVLAMGRLTHQKGLDILLDAFAQCARRCPSWHLTILGDGPDRYALEQQAAQLGIADRVSLPGNVAAPFPIMKAADLFVFPSRYEAFGMALAEAMACGLPVISSNCPSGPSDIVRDGVDGILVPPCNVAALAVSMEKLMKEHRHRDRLADRAVEVTERFSPERIFGEWKRLIRDVLQERGVNR